MSNNQKNKPKLFHKINTKSFLKFLQKDTTYFIKVGYDRGIFLKKPSEDEKLAGLDEIFFGYAKQTPLALCIVNKNEQYLKTY